MGGKFGALRVTGECDHPETVITTTHDVERTLCPTCGWVSFRFLAERDGEVERSRFSRGADSGGKSPVSPR